MKPLRQLLTGGDVMSPKHFIRARQALKGCRINNMYGPTENTAFTSGYTADIIAHHGVLDKGVNFIQKPYLLKDLAARLREVLEQE